MEEVRIKKIFANTKFHLRVMWRGFCKTVYGVLIAGLIAMAIYGLASAQKEVGWDAVFDYTVASVLLIKALGNMYFTGRMNNGGTKNKGTNQHKRYKNEMEAKEDEV